MIPQQETAFHGHTHPAAQRWLDNGMSIPTLSLDDFNARAFDDPYLLEKGPYKITGLIDQWKDTERWRQLDYLKTRFGDLRAHANAPNFITNARDRLCSVKTTFADYLDYVAAPENLDTIYKDGWVAGSPEQLGASGLPLYCGGIKIVRSAKDPILEELSPILPDAIEAWNADIPLFYLLYNHFWLLVSLPGAVTPLHADNNATMAYVAQLKGKKRTVLLSPFDRPQCFSEEVGYMNPYNPDPAFYPDYQSATPWVGEIAPGETLLFGPNWAHHIVSLTSSISISLDWVNATNIDRYAREPQWAEALGARLKDKPHMAAKFGNALSASQIESLSPLHLGRAAMTIVLEDALKDGHDTIATRRRGAYLRALRQVCDPPQLMA